MSNSRDSSVSQRKIKSHQSSSAVKTEQHSQSQKEAESQVSNVAADEDAYLIKLLLSYTGTLSIENEKILRFIAKNEKKQNAKASPYSIAFRAPLFGPSLASMIKTTIANSPVAGSGAVNGKRKRKKKVNPKGITDDEIRQYLVAHRGKEPPFLEIFRCLDRSKLKQTILEFPIHLALNPRKKVKNQLVRGSRDVLYSNENRDALLDPRFVLVALWHLVSASVMLNCHDFIHSGAFSLVISSLSSEYESMRSVSYSILQRFYRQLESASAYYLEAPYWLWFVDSLRSYLVREPNERICRLVTVFINCSLEILTDPTHVMFASIREFFTRNFTRLNAELVASKVNEFLHSTNALHYKIHFDFASKVLEYGLTSDDDFQAANSRLIFDWIMLFAHSRVTSHDELIHLVRILNSVLSISLSCVRVLCSQCNLLNFILQVTLRHAQRTPSDSARTSGAIEARKRTKKRIKLQETVDTLDTESKEVIEQIKCCVGNMLFYFDGTESDLQVHLGQLDDSKYPSSVKVILAHLQVLRGCLYQGERGRE